MMSAHLIERMARAAHEVAVSLGLMGLATCLGALLTLATIGVFNAVVWYARLHYRLLKPAIEQA